MQAGQLISKTDNPLQQNNVQKNIGAKAGPLEKPKARGYI
jgi:hypothetical protein